MLRMSLIPTTQKLMEVVDEFGTGDCGENKVTKTSALVKKSNAADYPSSNHVSYAVSNFVSNFAKNVSNYLSQGAKKTFDQLRQVFTKALIFQHFNLE